MTRTRIWLVLLLVLAATSFALAAPASPSLVGTWRMVAVTDSSGTEWPVPATPGKDHPGLTMTTSFGADATYETRARAMHPGDKAPREVITKGRWSLAGTKLTLHDDAGATKTVDIVLAARSLRMAVPGVGDARFDRVK